MYVTLSVYETEKTVQDLLIVGMASCSSAFYCARVAARALVNLNIQGAIVFMASTASYRPNKVGQKALNPFNVTDVSVARPFNPMRCFQSRSSKPDTQPGHGVGTIRHSREQRLSGPGQYRYDVLGREAAGLAAAVEVLRRMPRLAEI